MATINPKTTFKGIISALVTPFTKEGKVDVAALKKITEFEITEVGVDGLYICGSTGEAFLMDYEERRLVFETVAAVRAKSKKEKSVTLIAHIGGLNCFEIAKLAKDVKGFGYDGISAVTPYYYPYTFAAVKGYYEYVAQHAQLPLFIYYLPALTSVNVNVDNFQELLDIKGVVGVKFSSPDLFLLETLISRNKQKVFLFGVDEHLMAATTLGIDGAIGSTYNLLGKMAKEIFALTKKDEIAKARALTKKYNLYLRDMLPNGIYQTLKQATAYAAGAGDTYCRPPMGEVTKAAREAAKALAKAAAAK